MGFFDLLKRKTKTVQTIQDETEEPQSDYNKISSEIIDTAIDVVARKESGFTYNDNLDPLFCDVSKMIVALQQCSISMIQQKFSIGYNRAGRIVDQLTNMQIVSPTSDYSQKQVLISNEKDLDILLNTISYLGDVDTNEFREKYKERINERIGYYSDLSISEEEKQKRIYIEAEKERIKQEILEKRREKELRKQAIEELREEGLIESVRRREPIPQEVQDAVWRRDGGRCVKCGSQEHLEFDHIIPLSKGGSNTVRNLQLLCQKCNREKSNHIG
jgi:hypothetical protein